jgi:hypothetical protein
MTRTPEDDKAAIKAFLLRELAKKRPLRDTLNTLIAEYEQLAAEHDGIQREWNKRTHPWPNSPGRPGIWNSELGLELVISVREIQAANNNCSKRKAIGILKKQSPEKWGSYKTFKKGHEELESKLSVAEKYWLEWVKRNERVDARLAELNKLASETEGQK